MIMAATGHRPDKLGGYGDEVTARLIAVAEKGLLRLKPSGMIVGMALGFDLAVAAACVRLDVPFKAAVPFPGQEARWPEATKERYRLLLSRAEEVVFVSDGVYAAWKMHKRNEWMVDRSSAVVALYDGSREGGTFRCVEYARKKKREVHNLWGDWING